MISNRFYLFLTVLLLFVSGLVWKKWLDPKKTEPLKEQPFHIHGNQIAISQEIRNSLTLEIAEVEIQPISIEREYIGQIEPDPDRIEWIGFRLPGKVVKFYKKVGDPVKKGEVVLSIDSAEVARLRSQYHSLVSKWEVARKNSNRIAELVRNKLASDQEKRNAELEVKILESELQSLYQNLKLQGISPTSTGTLVQLRAGIDGNILERMVAPGATFSENAAIAKIGDLGIVWFQIFLFEKDLAHVHPGQEVTVELNAYPGETFSGILEHISQSVERDTGSIPARVRIHNKSGKLRIGLTGKAIIRSSALQQSSSSPIWLIEESAITEIDGVRGVFLSHSDRLFEWNPIQIVGMKEGFVYWKDNRDDRVKSITYVKKGAYQLKSLYLRTRFQEE